MVYGNNIQSHMQSAQLYAALGYTADTFANAIASRGGNPQFLSQIADQFQMASGYHVGQAVGSFLSQGLNPQGFVPPPSYPSNPQVANGYAMNIGSGYEQSLFNMDPRTRAAVEREFGGRIVHGNPNDGVVQVMPFRPGVTPAGSGHGNQAHFHAADYLAGMNQASAGSASNPLRGALSRILQDQLLRSFQSGGNIFGPQNQGNAGNAAGPVDQQRAFFGTQPGTGPFRGSLQGGSLGSQPTILSQGAATSGVPNNSYAGVMSDPSLTVEDKVALAFMLILKKFDKDIEQQMNRVNAMQNQQGNQGNSSIDVEALKLSRMVTKRQQMADILRQIIDKYNQTAKGVIDGIGR
ncbi:MAG TPA: hypothetical protein RMG48_22135 [Myxococcales bacterium LLY-WYZ-16_1]|nr:hypothetical protein [Myxococcales bacterium LLY-WYZ-16_1]